MRFKMKSGRGFSDTNTIHTTQIIAKKFNGYKVINPDGNECFLCFTDIDIVELSEDEKNLRVEL